jgi:hypothetical protein
MPTLTFSSTGPLTANIPIEGTTIRDVGVTDLADGLVAVDLGSGDVGARFVGRADTMAAMLAEATQLLAELRGRR